MTGLYNAITSDAGYVGAVVRVTMRNHDADTIDWTGAVPLLLKAYLLMQGGVILNPPPNRLSTFQYNRLLR